MRDAGQSYILGRQKMSHLSPVTPRLDTSFPQRHLSPLQLKVPSPQPKFKFLGSPQG